MIPGLIRQYFGTNAASPTSPAALQGIGGRFDAAIQSIDANLGEWNPSAQGAIDLARIAGEGESALVVAREWSKRKIQASRVALQAAQLMGSHQQQLANIALETKKLQENQFRALAAPALALATTEASHQGRVNGIAASRAKLFGG